MAKALLAALLVFSATAVAQTPPAQPPPTPTPAPSGTTEDDLRREIENTRRELKEVREEIRAQLATQSAAQGWQDEWAEEKRKLELFVPDGYFRVRPDLFNKLDLGRDPDPSGYTLFPRSPSSPQDRTQAGVNMRFRFEPTINVSEEVRIRAQIDALDNVIFGSSPEYAFSRGGPNSPYNRNEFSVLNETQVPPRSAINALQDSISVKRVFGEVSTPVGILRFGRMGSHWGLGMLQNDGNCFDCDWGNSVDRIMFVSEPISGWFITPMIDFDVEGVTSYRQNGGGQPFDATNGDDAHSYLIAIARRDTEQQARAKLDNNLSVLNYGLHFTYRVQRLDSTDYLSAPFVNEGLDAGVLTTGFVPRNANLFIPDLWLKFERRTLRIEAEVAAVFGSIGNRATNSANVNDPVQNQSLSVLQFGAVGQGEYRLLDGSLKLMLELGFASGDRASGFGNYPRRRSANPDGTTQPGDIDGPQYACGVACTDRSINNFRFNRDYRIDMILFREIIGGVTDTLYAKPQISYTVAEGFDLFGAARFTPSRRRRSSTAGARTTWAWS